jgi:magnesium transporter
MEIVALKLEEAFQSRNFTELRDVLDNLPPSEIATLLSDLPGAQQAPIFRILPRKLATTTFEYLPLERQEELLKSLAQEDVAAILNEMAPDDRTRLLEELPAVATRQLLGLLDEKERAVAIKLLGYPEGSVGRLMTPEYIAVRPHWAVQQVLDHVRRHGQDSETLNLVYVVDGRGMLIDDIRMRRLLLADPASRVTELMDNHFVALKATDDSKTAVNVFRKADLAALPVTDSEGVLIGIVTNDDILDVAEERATEEIQKFGGSEALDEPYMKIAFLRMVKKRAGW